MEIDLMTPNQDIQLERSTMSAPYTYAASNIAFIRRNHPVMNVTCADQLLHNMGLRSYCDKARALARVDVNHLHNGSRYWITADLIDAAQCQLLAIQGSTAHA
jgi:hypothetical protein